MTRVTERINSIKMPSNIRKEIGLSEDWKKKISPKEINDIIKTAFRFKDALRKLSKN